MVLENYKRFSEILNRLLHFACEVNPHPPLKIEGNKPVKVRMKRTNEKGFVYPFSMNYYNPDPKFTISQLVSLGNTLGLPEKWWEE
ncbi:MULTISPECIES: hypothetical protein [Leptospira]|uniref:hypothetical protein n=1 Tax=Leptospira TaxID=171 RepID=UPI0009765625|nr:MULTISPECIES: hypothetical protein [Leptospira]OMI16701.1 hypothetical protein BUQ74_14005 [Leptospira weilii serovar Heyan]ULH29232.1 hypothetical protein FH586_04760 [Leptospira weilii]UPY81132.1 hypothetical protein FH581_023040 [Leptospira weilii]